MIRIMNTVATTMMDAVHGKRIPKVGFIENGYRVVAKTATQVVAYPKWWLVSLHYEKLKIGFRNIGVVK